LHRQRSWKLCLSFNVAVGSIWLLNLLSMLLIDSILFPLAILPKMHCEHASIVQSTGCVEKASRVIGSKKQLFLILLPQV
jgi:competence protein ComGC